MAGSIAAYGIGLAIVWALRYSRGEPHAELMPTLVRRLAGYVTYAVVYGAMRVGVFADLSGGWEDLLPFGVALAAWIAVEVGMRALIVVGPKELSRSYLARSLVHDLNVFLGLALSGALFGELFTALAWWALPIAVLPYAFAHTAFRRFQQTKVTYKQTIRALARIPEVSGLGVDGHADRTTDRHGTPPRLLVCEFNALGYTLQRFDRLPDSESYFAAFQASGPRPAPSEIQVCPE